MASVEGSVVVSESVQDASAKTGMIYPVCSIVVFGKEQDGS